MIRFNMVASLRQVGRRIVKMMALLLFTLTVAVPGLAAPWIQTTSLPLGVSDHTMVYASGFLYHAGGVDSINGESARVFYSQVQSNGTIGVWNETSPLPAVIRDHAGVTANGFVYVLGGLQLDTDGGYVTTNAVYYSKINTNASLGIWQPAIPLPQPALLFLSASVWNNRIYATGGWNGQTLINNVYSATIQADGSLSAWVTQRPLPVAIYAHAGVANGMLYVFGGAINGGTTVTNKVYYAKINDDGTLGVWNETTPLPLPLNNHGAVAAGGRVYVMGGAISGGFLANVHYSAPVAGDGSLGAWSAGPVLPYPEALFGLAVTDSHIFLSGGQGVQLTDSTVYSMALPLPPAAPAIVSQSFTNGNFQLGFSAQTNTGFGLLASTNLTDWLRISSGFTDTNGVLLLQDTNAASFPRRFYRTFWPLP